MFDHLFIGSALHFHFSMSERFEREYFCLNELRAILEEHVDNIKAEIHDIRHEEEQLTKKVEELKQLTKKVEELKEEIAVMKHEIAENNQKIQEIYKTELFLSPFVKKYADSK